MDFEAPFNLFLCYLPAKKSIWPLFLFESVLVSVLDQVHVALYVGIGLSYLIVPSFGF